VISVRVLGRDELSRAREIDVSESGHVLYRCVDGEIVVVDEEWSRPSWNAAEWQDAITRWTDELKWDVMLGAFAEDALVAMASLRYRLTETTAQLVSLHVSRGERRRGAASSLLDEIIRLAKEAGARELYVSATPSESAVGFYLARGFRPATRIDEHLHALEPDDIHMTRSL
jgi:GNAT superfamily N-acetyltransferase